MKKVQNSLLYIILFVLNSSLFGQAEPIKIIQSESYELANIILAITPYGKTDPWEVYKNSAYYRDVIAHFDKYSDLPLISKVNYSREKWDKYLSFRTDSYGFEFDSTGALIKIRNFFTVERINEFEENIDLINDFVKVSHFREFYKNHRSYYKAINNAYGKSQMIPEIVDFLHDEFKIEKASGFAIVISPLVNRMNCLRPVDNIPTSFITLPQYIFESDSNEKISEYDMATNLHMLFTEIDHDFVNPTTEKYEATYNKDFEPTKWDMGSGYEKNTFATFNEYMTWAVYDLFIYKYFPKIANDVIKDWQLQNESRKFFASALFSYHLKELYNNRKDGEDITDLYPALLNWCGEIQNSLSVPSITKTTITPDKISVVFSEKMEMKTKLDAYLIIKKDTIISQQIDLADIQWENDGQTVSFKTPFDFNYNNELYLNAAWRTKTTFKTIKGINLPTYTKIEQKKN